MTTACVLSAPWRSLLPLVNLKACIGPRLPWILHTKAAACMGMARGSLGALLLLASFALVMPAALAQSGCALLCNIDFEDAQVVSPGGFGQFNETVIPCWNTTASDNQIEVWGNGFSGVPAYSGNQFIELNANMVSTIYQEFQAQQGASVVISFAHRGRAGTDVMGVAIGPAGGPYTSLGSFSAGNTAWVYNTVNFTFATAGTYALRFTSISAAGGATVGNFLDAISVNLPQPVIASTQTDPGCANAADGAIQLTVTGGQAPYTYSWTGATTSTGSQATGLGPGPYAVVVTDAFGCQSTASYVLAPQAQPPNAGTDGALVLCSSGGPNNVFAALGGTPDVGGIWTGPGGGAFAGVFTPGVNVPGVYTYTIAGTAPCPDASASVTVTVNVAPNAGINGALTLCSTDAAVPLITALGGTPDTGGTWTAPGGAAFAGVFDPAVNAPGMYTYTIVGSAPCPNASATVTVVVNEAPDAGGPGALTLCSTGTAAPLFAALGGIADAGGTWTAPGGIAFTGVFNPAVDTPGAYTYTVAGLAPCSNASATVAVGVNVAPVAGSNGSITLCINAGPVALFTALGGSPDAGGTWNAPDGGAFNGLFTPSGNAPGAYTYTVMGTAPCADASATVTVQVDEVVPVAEISLVEWEPCTPAQVVLAGSQANGVTCTWWLGDGQVVQGCDTITVTYTEAGTYDVTLLVDAGNTCGTATASAPALVTIQAQPMAAFTVVPERVSTLDPEVSFLNQSVDALAYQWTFGDGTGTEEVNPTHRYVAVLGDRYEGCLVAFGVPPCIDTVCTTLTVADAALHVPNAFTPNGDGINDLFYPVLLMPGASGYRFEVFDRYGRSLFLTNEPGVGWTGRFADGADEVPVGVYVWKLSVKDGYSGTLLERTGHLSLVR